MLQVEGSNPFARSKGYGMFEGAMVPRKEAWPPGSPHNRRDVVRLAAVPIVQRLFVGAPYKLTRPANTWSADLA